MRSNSLHIEPLEDRRLLTAAPLDFAGTYLATVSGVSIEVVLANTTKTPTQYTGQIKSGGQVINFTAAETNNALSGSIAGPGGTKIPVTATLSGDILTLDDDGQNTTLTLQTSTKLVSHTGTEFSYAIPSGWTNLQAPAGILLSSSDKTTLIGVSGGTAKGVYSSHAIVLAAEKAGTSVTTDLQLTATHIGSENYSADAVLITYKASNGTLFASELLIATASNKTTDSTTMMVEGITAPVATFNSNAPELDSIFASIKPTGAASNATVTAKIPTTAFAASWFSANSMDFAPVGWNTPTNANVKIAEQVNTDYLTTAEKDFLTFNKTIARI